ELVKNTHFPLLLFPCYVLFADIAERKNERDQAEHFFTMAVEDLEAHQARLHHDDLRVTIFRGKHRAYEALVQLGLRKADPLQALRSAYMWSERAKSRGLIDLLSQHLPIIHANAEPSLLKKIERLREELNLLYARSQPEVTLAPPAGKFENIAIKEDELAR